MSKSYLPVPPVAISEMVTCFSSWRIAVSMSRCGLGPASVAPGSNSSCKSAILIVLLSPPAAGVLPDGTPPGRPGPGKE